MQHRDAGKRRCRERRWRDSGGILEREPCADGSMPSGLAPLPRRATMQKHETKRVAGEAPCNCLKTKGQICRVVRPRSKEEGMKLGRGEGVVSVANTGLTGGGFWKCGNDWSYGRIFGSVANTGVSDILEEGRGRGGRGEKYRAAGAHGACGTGYRKPCPNRRSHCTIFGLFVKQ